MGFDISDNPFREPSPNVTQQTTTPQTTATTQSATTDNTQSLIRDQLQTAASTTPLRTSTEASAPQLTQQNVYTPVSDTLSTTQSNLPSSSDLVKQLAPETQNQVKEAMENYAFEPGDANLRKFFDMLAKLLPMSQILLYGIAGDGKALDGQQMMDSVLKMLQEMGEMLGKHGNMTALSPENKQLLLVLAEQLKALMAQGGDPQKLMQQMEALTGKFSAGGLTSQDLEGMISQIKGLLAGGNLSSNQDLIQKLLAANLLPQSALEGEAVNEKALQNLLSNLQAASLNGQGAMMNRSLSMLANLLAVVRAFPTGHQGEVANVMVSMQSMLSGSQAHQALGNHTLQLGNNLSNFAAGLARQMGLSPADASSLQAGSQYLSRVFSGLILVGGIMGRLMVDRGDGHSLRCDELGDAGKLQINLQKELKINDLIPFSFLAFYAPFQDLGGGNSDAQKEAKKALADLIRVLMKLVFMLVALFTGGKKMGEGGTELLLKEYTGYLMATLDDLIFSLKKTKEIFGVPIKVTLQYVMSAKQALQEADYDAFWEFVFLAVQEDSPLQAFLEEVDQLDSLYETLRASLQGSGFDASQLRM